MDVLVEVVGTQDNLRELLNQLLNLRLKGMTKGSKLMEVQVEPLTYQQSLLSNCKTCYPLS